MGFIGSNLARRLVQMGDVDVHLLDALLPDQGGNAYNVHDIVDRVTVHAVDLGCEWAVNHLVGGMDYIFNLAAAVSHVESMRDPHRDLALNCSAHLTLLNACRSYNTNAKIVFTSTRQVYGRPLYLPLDEQHRVAPPDVNGINKLAAEHYHLLYRRVYGTRAVCLRLTNTYGPRQHVRDDRHGFLGWFIRQALRGGELELFGEGRQRRDVNYVDDVVDALLMAGGSEAVDGEIFNLGGDPVTVAELAQSLISIAERGSLRLVPFPDERQRIDIGNSYCSYDKFNAAVGWRPRTPLQEGLARTVEFYRKHGAHYWKADADSVSRSDSAA
jgi:UDP-glucose 4-epimerase